MPGGAERAGLNGIYWGQDFQDKPSQPPRCHAAASTLGKEGSEAHSKQQKTTSSKEKVRQASPKSLYLPPPTWNSC